MKTTVTTIQIGAGLFILTLFAPWVINTALWGFSFTVDNWRAAVCSVHGGTWTKMRKDLADDWYTETEVTCFKPSDSL